MTLTFPTIAEQVSAKADELGSVAKAMRALGQVVEPQRKWNGERVYWFDDDTRLITKGAGKNYTKRTELP